MPGDKIDGSGNSVEALAVSLSETTVSSAFSSSRSEVLLVDCSRILGHKRVCSWPKVDDALSSSDDPSVNSSTFSLPPLSGAAHCLVGGPATSEERTNGVFATSLFGGERAGQSGASPAAGRVGAFGLLLFKSQCKEHSGASPATTATSSPTTALLRS